MIIPEHTVFVLGAGTSVPYRLPTGMGLADKICELAREKRPSLGLGRYALEATGASEVYLREFGRDLSSAGVSIDEFVKDQQGFTTIAKAMIAAVLLDLERDEFLCPGGANFNAKQDWLGYLLQHVLRDGLEALDRIAFVTFNFDRLIERRIFVTLKARHGKDVAKQKIRETFHLIHVSGILGQLEETDATSGRVVPFAAELTAEHVKRALEQIQFVHETRAEHDLDAAHQCLLKAPLVCFIGFGFHPDNVKALGIQGAVPESTPFVGSYFGMTASEAREVEIRFTPARLRLYERLDALSFLRAVPNLHGPNDHRPSDKWEDD